VVIPVVLLAFGALTPIAIPSLWALSTPWRILIALALLAPIGFAMGMAFPRGLELVRPRAPAGTPWLWAVNGVASVLGSLAAVLVSISAGISAAFWSGTAAYVIAAAAGVRMAGRISARPDESPR
jgi:hypothetical protein